jgi:transposase
LKTKYKIDVCNSTVLNELRKRRLKCKMPQITVSSPDPDFDRKKKEIDGLIVDFALNRNHIREHAYLFFLDETLFSLNPPLVKTISKTGEQQKIRTIGDNTNIKVFGAVEPFQGYLLHEFSKTKKSVDFVNFIEYLDYILGKRRKLYVILDNYGIHNSDYTESFIEDLEYEDHLQRLWLPSYSPKLNWIESIWKDAKNHIANFPFNNTDEIIIAVENHWLSLSKKDIQRKIGLNTRLNKMLSKF